MLRGALAMVLLAFASTATAAPTWLQLGGFSGQPYSGMIGTALSGDGSTVVGTVFGTDGSQHAYRWTAATGTQDLGVPHDSTTAYLFPFGTSYDGAVITGTTGGNGFRWTGQQGSERIISDGYGDVVSRDGSQIAGSANGAVRWTRTEGVVALTPVLLAPDSLGYLNGEGRSFSGDGSVIVGEFYNSSRELAFRWTAATGAVLLADLPGGADRTFAADIAVNGTLIVGASGNFPGVFRPVLWTAAGEIEALADPTGWFPSGEAISVSGDGSIIIGFGGQPGSPNQGFIWQRSTGMRRVADVLAEEYGLAQAISGWTQMAAQGISDDGTVLSGSGIDPSGREAAWIVVIPEPGAAPLLATGLVALAITGRRLKRAEWTRMTL